MKSEEIAFFNRSDKEQQIIIIYIWSDSRRYVAVSHTRTTDDDDVDGGGVDIDRINKREKQKIKAMSTN